jgi:hypothetical protein
LRNFINILSANDEIMFFDVFSFRIHNKKTEIWTFWKDNKLVDIGTSNIFSNVLLICNKTGFCKYMLFKRKFNLEDLDNFFNYILYEIKNDKSLSPLLESKKLLLYVDEKQSRRLIPFKDYFENF